MHSEDLVITLAHVVCEVDGVSLFLAHIPFTDWTVEASVQLVIMVAVLHEILNTRVRDPKM